METKTHSAAPARPDPALQQRMLQLIYGMPVAQAISAFASLGVPETLSPVPRHVDDIAAAVGADAPTLYRLLRALASQGLVTELEGPRFTSTPLGETLRRDAPGSCAPLAIMFGSRFHRAAWTGLAETVSTGGPAFSREHGVPAFEYLSTHPEDAAIFNAAMTNVAEAFIATTLPACDFGHFRTLVDVGGGQGFLLGAILTRYPAARGVLFDLPGVVDGARSGLARMGVENRVEIVAGSFFDAIPPGGDAYLLSNILHDWSDEDAVRILDACRAAMNPGSVLLIFEGLLGDNPAADPLLALVDLEMLVTGEGARQRTRREFEGLLGQAGLWLARVTSGPVASILEARAEGG
ncbi:MAG: methyltransferase [Candidatus Dormibacteraeota bacterium]|nr:methyltransferase [Candidatus Dormibacteraeota bacterium]